MFFNKIVNIFRNAQTAKDITAGVKTLAADATDTKDITGIEYVMHGYKSNNIGPTKKRALALEDKEHLPDNIQTAKIPKVMKTIIENKKCELQGIMPQAKRQRIESASTQASSRKSLKS